jgi:hypothetical protein
MHRHVVGLARYLSPVHSVSKAWGFAGLCFMVCLHLPAHAQFSSQSAQHSVQASSTVGGVPLSRNDSGTVLNGVSAIGVESSQGTSFLSTASSKLKVTDQQVEVSVNAGVSYWAEAAGGAGGRHLWNTPGYGSIDSTTSELNNQKVSLGSSEALANLSFVLNEDTWVNLRMRAEGGVSLGGASFSVSKSSGASAVSLTGPGLALTLQWPSLSGLDEQLLLTAGTYAVQLQAIASFDNTSGSWRETMGATSSLTIQAIPEVSTSGMMLLGLAGMALAARRKDGRRMSGQAR